VDVVDAAVVGAGPELDRLTTGGVVEVDPEGPSLIVIVVTYRSMLGYM
jgi:hypothetical protein